MKRVIRLVSVLLLAEHRLLLTLASEHSRFACRF